MNNKNNYPIILSQEEIRDAIDMVIRYPDLSSLSLLHDKKFWKKQIFTLLNIFKCDITSYINEQTDIVLDYRQEVFFRKFVCYICELKDTTQEQRCKFADDIENKAEDNSGYVLFGMIDRLDNINKLTIFANLTRARLDKFISIEQFFRLYSLLERIPYVDLCFLSKYATEYYDESGDTELLYATGALIQTSIDPEGNSKYKLSVLGEELIRWGAKIPIYVERKQGTKIIFISEEKFNSIFSDF